MLDHVTRGLFGHDMPSVLGRYEIGRRLGSGGFGTVYQALDPRIGRRVALKLLRGSNGAALVGALRREGVAMARFNHPNIVEVFDFGVASGRAYLVMELIEGSSLSRSDACVGPLKARLRVLLAAAEGLAEMHRQGAVHGDVKPANILVGNDGRVCVSDMGLARLREDVVTDEASADGVRIVIGTPAYMAPEHRAGHPPTALADQYSWAVSAMQVLESLDEGPLVTRIRRVLKRALADDPGKRFPGMERLVHEVRRAALPRTRRVVERVLVVGALGALTWSIATAGKSPAVVPETQDLCAELDADAPWPQVGHTLSSAVDGALNRYRQRWDAAVVVACEPSDDPHEGFASHCLATARLQAVALTNLAEERGLDPQEHVRRVEDLQPPEDCLGGVGRWLSPRTEALVRAQQLRRLGDPEAAAAVATSTLVATDDPRVTADAHFVRGLARLDLGRDGAIEDLEAAYLLAVRMDDAWLASNTSRAAALAIGVSGRGLADAQVWLDRTTAAVERMRFAASQAAALDLARAKLAAEYARWDDAEGWLEDFEARHPNAAFSYGELEATRGAVSMGRGAFGDAAQAFARAIEHAPTATPHHVNLHYNAAQAAFASGTFDATLGHASQSVRLAKRYGLSAQQALALEMRARGHYFLRDTSAAQADLAVATELLAETPDPRAGFAVRTASFNLAFDEAKFEDARTHALMALDACVETFGDDHPQCDGARGNLGRALHGLGDLEGARERLDGAWSSCRERPIGGPACAQIGGLLCTVLEEGGDEAAASACRAAVAEHKKPPP